MIAIVREMCVFAHVPAFFINHSNDPETNSDMNYICKYKLTPPPPKKKKIKHCLCLWAEAFQNIFAGLEEDDIFQSTLSFPTCETLQIYC